MASTSNKVKEIPQRDQAIPGKEPEAARDVKEDGSKPITFFSRWREDTLTLEQSEMVEVAPRKWVTKPAKQIIFHDRAFVTDDEKKIKFLRSHPRYGREIFEFGVPEHEERIQKIDDAGRILELEKMHRLGRIVEARHRKGLDSNQ